MSDENAALHLKTLAEHNYTSGDLKSAMKNAKRSHKLHPSLAGLPEMLAAFKIHLAAAAPVFVSDKNSIPDYYNVLQVERFSHINTIKKQYKKLALSLHPDKSQFSASEEAFKLVGEAMGVLTDRIRRKEYDMRLRISMQSRAEVEVGGEGVVETFWTACSSCRLLHKFERKYLGHNLMCPKCKKSFEAVEVEGGEEDDVGVEMGQTRVSARIRERVAKSGDLGIKRKVSGEDEDGVLLKDMRLKRMKKVEKLGGRDEGGVEGRLKEVRELVDVDRSGESGDDGMVDDLRLRRVVGTLKNEVAKEGKSGGAETVVNGRAKRAKSREEETMTLFQFQMLAKKKRKKKKIDEGKLRVGEKEDNAEKLDEKGGENEKEKDMEIGKEVEKEKEKEIDDERENDTEIGEERNMEEIGEEKETEEMEEEKEKEIVHMREKSKRRGVSKYRNLEFVGRTSKSRVDLEIETHRASKKRNVEVRTIGNENDNEKNEEKEKEVGGIRNTRERRRVSKYANLETVKRKTSENHVNSEIERLIATKKGNVEIMPVEDSEFHDFDKDRRERSFRKGQVWAIYDDDGGMPRHYVLVHEIVSVNPFHVTVSWLQFQSSNGDEDLTSWRQMGFHVSCGRFKVSGEVSVKYLNLFSHVVSCERAAREVYRIYPTKGSVWALYKNNAMDSEERDQTVKDNKKCYDIVVSLSSYSDLYGLSVARLEKVDGFRTIFRRKEVGANAVIWLGKNDIKLFSHQIPAKKLSGDEASDLPKDCWELDPASLTSQLLIRS